MLRKIKMRKIKNISVLLVTMLLTSTTWAQTQFVEEVASLEGIYEARARAVLNTFLRPHDYTIVVSAEIQADEEQIDDIRADMEMRFLPGMPIEAAANLVPGNNKLHEVKSKIDVHLVLNDDISPDKENLLKEVLAAKLHLDKESGDSLTVKRSNLPNLNPDAKVEKLPELSWKMWALIVLISMLTLAGLFYYFNNKGRQQD